MSGPQQRERYGGAPALRALIVVSALALEFAGAVAVGAEKPAVETMTWCQRDPGYERVFSFAVLGGDMYVDGFRLGRSQAIVDGGAIATLVRAPASVAPNEAEICPSSRCIHRVTRGTQVTEEVGCLSSRRVTKLLEAYETLRKGKPLFGE